MRRIELMNGATIEIDAFYNSATIVDGQVKEAYRAEISSNNNLKPRELAELMKNNFDGSLKVVTDGEEQPIIYENLEFSSVNFSVNEKGVCYSIYFKSSLE